MTGKYMIVSANSLGKLAQHVDTKMAEGWRPLGSFERLDENTYAQAMIKPATIGPSETKIVESGMEAKVTSPP